MAERRMFAKSIVLSDAFLDMPMSARCLYFTLGMLADDDGFVGGIKSIMRQCGASEDDIKILLGKRYLLCFDSGVIVIKHWRMNNYLRNDRHNDTTYLEELESLILDKKGSYTEKNKENIRYTNGIPMVSTGKDSIDKYSIDKDSINNNICATSETEVAPTPTKYKFPCKPSKSNKKTEWVLSQEDLDWYQETYPNLNIDQELRKMWKWLKDNNLKTYQGMSKFVSGWLARANDKQPSKRTQEEIQIDNEYKVARTREINQKLKNNIEKTEEMFDKAHSIEFQNFLKGGNYDTNRSKELDTPNKSLLPNKEDTG